MSHGDNRVFPTASGILSCHPNIIWSRTPRPGTTVTKQWVLTPADACFVSTHCFLTLQVHQKQVAAIGVALWERKCNCNRPVHDLYLNRFWFQVTAGQGTGVSHLRPPASLCFLRQHTFCADVWDELENTQGGFTLLNEGSWGTAYQSEVSAGLLWNAFLQVILNRSSGKNMSFCWLTL